MPDMSDSLPAKGATSSEGVRLEVGNLLRQHIPYSRSLRVLGLISYVVDDEPEEQFLKLDFLWKAMMDTPGSGEESPARPTCSPTMPSSGLKDLGDPDSPAPADIPSPPGLLSDSRLEEDGESGGGTAGVRRLIRRSPATSILANITHKSPRSRTFRRLFNYNANGGGELSTTGLGAGAGGSGGWTEERIRRDRRKSLRPRRQIVPQSSVDEQEECNSPSSTTECNGVVGDADSSTLVIDERPEDQPAVAMDTGEGCPTVSSSCSPGTVQLVGTVRASPPPRSLSLAYSGLALLNHHQSSYRLLLPNAAFSLTTATTSNAQTSKTTSAILKTLCSAAAATTTKSPPPAPAAASRPPSREEGSSSSPEEPGGTGATTGRSQTTTTASSSSGGGGYKCRYCGKLFNRKFCRERHERLHTGVKPYTCEVCGERFIRLEDKKRHVRTGHHHSSGSSATPGSAGRGPKSTSSPPPAEDCPASPPTPTSPPILF